MKKKSLIFTFLVSLFILFCSFVLSLLFGAEKITDFKTIIAQSASEIQNFQKIIFFNIRLPRSLLVLLSGVLLAGAGSIFQLFFRNPLAEPGLIGISSGATLGAVCTQVFGITVSAVLIPATNLFAFLGAILSGSIVTIFAFRKSTRESTVMLLLCGTALGTLYSAISSLIILSNTNKLQSIYAWNLGSFSGKTWNELFFILIPAAISIVTMFLLSPSLDLLSVGEKSAQSLGVDIKKIRILVLFSGALAASASVCAGGTISFVGLIAPHITRKIAGPKAKTLLPFSMCFGAILLLLSDTLARTVIAPAEIPTGIITSILGVPFFISLISRESKK
ncbi:MAG: iron ABC transporter permease [Spirochaetia bacterium]|nr:iron ABC transporter permease [Spirochaetia bacterium]